MPETIIADSSCLIVLTNIGELDLLRRTFGRITITPGIVEEYGAELPGWVSIISPSNSEAVERLLVRLDRGEAPLHP